MALMGGVGASAGERADAARARCWASGKLGLAQDAKRGKGE
jgi:hypothetical protein